MNGFLVVARYRLDDVPTGFYSTRMEAEAHLEDEPSEVIVNEFGGDITNDIISHLIIEFMGGVPVPKGTLARDSELQEQRDAVKRAAHPNCPECHGEGWRDDGDGTSVSRCRLCLPEHLQTARY